MLRRIRLSVSFLLILILAVWLPSPIGPRPAAAGAQGLVQKVWEKLGVDQPVEGVPVRLRLHISDEPVVNAWTTPTTGDIYISQQMLGLVGSSEGELAFILGHEIGHVMGYWSGLSTQLQKQQLEADLSNLLSMLGLLFESEEERKNRYSHVEEKLADSIAFYMITEACYNPYDAAAFFGRLQMYSGTTDPLARLWKPYAATHPFKEDRIEHLRIVMRALQQKKTSASKNEAYALGWLRTLVTAAITYGDTYPDAGFPSSLQDLEQAGLIDSQLATTQPRGYRLTYQPGLPDAQARIGTFTMVARPVAYRCTGERSFFVDESGVIRFTREDRLASWADSPLEDWEDD
ncbi:MAG: M48 family metalloprotease [Acidobacteria bacterium]|nr:M48 family metalloprotease [Acidobacteriota bacterium]